MSVADYVAEVRRRILDTPHVVSHSLGYEDRPPIGAIINGTVTFADGSCLSVKEFLQLRPTPTKLKYSYHYASPTRSLIFRYDNARDPSGFLCHAGGKFLGLISCADDDKRFFAKSSVGLDVFYQAFVFDTRTVTDSPNPTINGTYRTTNHAGGATFRLNF